MDQQGQIQQFLTSRRARIAPQTAGLPVAGRKRRVPGLRREEVAALAGLSVDYYTRIERGALTKASDGVVQAIARALKLDAAEQAHLFDLAHNGKPSATLGVPTAPAVIAPQLQTVLDALAGAPALVRTSALEVIATNSPARALYSVMYDDTRVVTPNVARFTFLDPRARQFWCDWNNAADDLAAHLRAAAGANPSDPTVTELIDELSTRSDVFRTLWARHDVRAHGRGIKRFRHPIVGALELRYDHLHVAADPGLTMITYTAEPGTASHGKLCLLASWDANAGRPGGIARAEAASQD